MNNLESTRVYKNQRTDHFQRHELYYTEMDHTDGSVGGNYYEGQMKVCLGHMANMEQPKGTPSIYLNPKREGYGRLLYLTGVDNDTSHMDQILSDDSNQ